MRGKIILSAIALLVLFTTSIWAQADCIKIKDGVIIDAVRNKVILGFDQFGYNYQSHIFKGTFDTSDRISDNLYRGGTDFASIKLIMRWSDSWLSKRDCNHDYRLDRGGDGGLTDMSKGWLTNQVEGEYVGSDGKSHRYRYFVKIVYDGGTACKAGTPTCLWSLYAITKEVKNDPFGEFKYIDKNKLGNPARLRN